MECYIYFGTKSTKCFIYRIIYNFINKVMKSTCIG